MKSLKLILAAMVIIASVLGCQQTQKNAINSLTKAEKEQGWKLLFDGKDFNGWRSLGMDSVQTLLWKVEDGLIHKVDSRSVPLQPDGKPVQGSDLMTIDTFRNFELQFDWKIKPNGNSGIKYNVSEKISTTYGGKHSALGFEYQILDDSAKMYRGLKPYQFTGSLYDMYPPKNVHINPVGEFNHSRILLDGNHGEHWLNGYKVVDYNFGTAEFDSLFKESKYAKYPGFAKRRAGHIVITNHTDESWYKNIKIRRLPD